MLILDLDVFLKQVKQQMITHCRILDMEDNQVALFGDTNDSGSVSAIIKNLEIFAKDVHGRFKVIFKEKSIHKKISTRSVVVNFGDTYQGSTDGGKLGGESVRDIEDRVKAQITAEQENVTSIDQIKELKKQVAEGKKPGNKMAEVLSMAFEICMNKFAPGILQGTGGAEAVAEDEAEVSTEDKSDEDILNDALDIFDSVGVDSTFLLKLAQAVKKNPKLINTVKTFLDID